ncbi:hypothetical protein C8A00DRAFT_34449 [Chaetomidium leptoderma]|uniref:Uncharacterized protein n=1 Tax=Chaetomidium leptoderma TaxID=669021 RepID=A0AAN6VMA0_9PEZI|nr:hypothetical protein C8A00DRAFT_34449 [Chaetomidium leptoderma]
MEGVEGAEAADKPSAPSSGIPDPRPEPVAVQEAEEAETAQEDPKKQTVESLGPDNKPGVANGHAETADVQASTEPGSQDDPKLSKLPAHSAPAVPLHPSFTELSSRHTTPELDTSASFAREPNPPATPGETATSPHHGLRPLARTIAEDTGSGTKEGLRKAPAPSTPSGGPFQADNVDMLPEITENSLCLRDNEVVFTDPPLHEVYLEKGDKFDVASWVDKACHDPKLEQLREKNGLPRVGRPPAHAMGSPGSGSGKKVSASAPRSAQGSRKRKGPHETGAASKSGEAGSSRHPKKIKIIHPTSATRTTAAVASDSPTSPSAASSATLASALEYDGYTSTDSSSEQLHANDWRLREVRTRKFRFKIKPGVRQYWHLVTEEENPRDNEVVEHQTLGLADCVHGAIRLPPQTRGRGRGAIRERHDQGDCST